MCRVLLPIDIVQNDTDIASAKEKLTLWCTRPIEAGRGEMNRRIEAGRGEMNRRTFLQKSAFAIGGGVLAGSGFGVVAKEREMVNGQVMTVAGAVAPGTLGVTLPHEHVMVDFIGADKVSRDRYEADEVVEVVLPYLKQVRELGCETLVECTPAYIGRDAALLKRLSEASGVRLLTNTGYYGASNDKFVPAHAYQETADQLAQRWVREWEEGIEGTGVRPGFIKTGVDGGPLSEIDRKLVVAAARTYLKTGLTIAAHTGGGPAHEELAVLRKEGVDGSAWIWVHAQNEVNTDLHARAAEQGAWVEFDGIGPKSVEQHVDLVVEMKKRGFLDRVLISHDAGWYRPGEPDGGLFRPFDTLFAEFLPALRGAGFSDAEVYQLTVENPHRAFTVGVRTK